MLIGHVLWKVNILPWLPLDSSKIKVDKQGKLVGKLKISRSRLGTQWQIMNSLFNTSERVMFSE